MKIELPKFLIRMTGNTYLSKYPFWITYKPAHHKVKGYEVRKVFDVIKDGDILLRRYDGYLNTMFTPGFWGHAGLYIGGNKVIHAVGVGVIKEDVLDFCRTDSVCVLRIKDSHNHLIDRSIDIVSKMLDEKVKYDYKFSDKNKLVYCTEMINMSFDGIFYDDYEEVASNFILTPDGIRYSRMVKLIMEIKH